jgi:hypothetical protein
MDLKQRVEEYFVESSILYDDVNSFRLTVASVEIDHLNMPDIRLNITLEPGGNTYKISCRKIMIKSARAVGKYLRVEVLCDINLIEELKKLI